MSIMHYDFQRHMTPGNEPSNLQADDRYNRNPAQDIKDGLELIFELKTKIDNLHPIASEVLIRILS